jgi:hypothetical protein
MYRLGCFRLSNFVGRGTEPVKRFETLSLKIFCAGWGSRFLVAREGGAVAAAEEELEALDVVV